MIKTGLTMAAVIAVVAALSGCAPAEQTYRVYDYECCSSADVDAIYAPGQIVHLRWTPHRTRAAGWSKPKNPTISVKLYGAFSSAGLKAAVLKDKGKPVAVAALVHPSLSVPQKVSTDITIPADASPGFYDLEFLTTWSPGNTAGGSTIIQVR
jgi:hypothetical protein